MVVLSIFLSICDTYLIIIIINICDTLLIIIIMLLLVGWCQLVVNSK